MPGRNTYFKLLRSTLPEHILFLGLAVLSLYFYQERIFADSGYYLFRLINEGTFVVEHGRYVLALSQIGPLLAIKAGLGLKTILLTASLWHVLFYYFVFLLCTIKLNFKASAYILLLLQTLSLAKGFFVPMFELYYASALLVLFAALLFKLKRSIWLLFWIGVLTILIATAHFYAILLLAFIILLHATTGLKKDWKIYLFIFSIIAIILIVKSYFPTDYERGKTEAFIKNFQHAPYTLSYLRDLLKFLVRVFPAMLILLVFSIVRFVRTKDFLALTLLLLSFIILLAMANISCFGFDHSRYLEQVYFPMSVVVSFSLFFRKGEFSNRKPSSMEHIIAAAIVCFGFYNIYVHSESFTNRLQEMKAHIAIAQKENNRKFFIEESRLESDPNWSYPLESMFISPIIGNQKCVSICTKSDYLFQENDSRILGHQFIFRKWEIMNLSYLSESHFQLDSNAYTNLNSAY